MTDKIIDKAPFNRCVECDDVITNPLCTSCLAERMAMVVKEQDSELAKEIKSIEIEGDTTCIFCGKKMGLCAHCFSKDIYEFLLENNPKIAEDFISQFDFDLRRDFI
ncbi:MAG: hypothetical protein ABH824_07435 [Nanoarchaeota archaeon]|nr:hypothetical protein [Nanoarchaeota archaeon]MBU1632272.1 hypothetical protein [Nanoarchaeota archaeon]MBU1876041.1 hypothetical protein [Nanoarchaeota archaeon]